jgi:hypothetical protein
MTMRHLSARVASMLAALALCAACGGSAGTGDSEERTVFIGPQPIACMAMAPTECMSAGPTAQGPWSYMFVWSIEGFQYQPGFLYELRIVDIPDPHPPADGPSVRHVLVRLVSKTRVG